MANRWADLASPRVPRRTSSSHLSLAWSSKNFLPCVHSKVSDTSPQQCLWDLQLPLLHKAISHRSWSRAARRGYSDRYRLVRQKRDRLAEESDEALLGGRCFGEHGQPPMFK